MLKIYFSNIKFLAVLVIFVALLMLLVSFAPQQSNLPPSSANAPQSSVQYSSIHPMKASPAYYVNFTQTGFSNHSANAANMWEWTITINSATYLSEGSSQSFLFYNGTFTFTVGYYNTPYSYSMNPPSGTVYVNGNTGGIQINITFSNTSIKPTTSYDANFTVTNMPSVIPNTTWNYAVTLNGVNVVYSKTQTTSGTNTSFTGLKAGNYDFTISGFPIGTSLSPNSGSLTISKNTTVDLKVTLLKNYKLSFDSSGLSPSQSFSVTIAVGNGASTSVLENNKSYPSMSYVDFNLPNGTYYFTISSSSNGFSPTPSRGTIMINGGNIAINVAFSNSSFYYLVTFHVTNVPTTLLNYEFGFDVEINSYAYSLQNYGTTISFSLENGSYTFADYFSPSIPATTTAGLSPSSGTFSIQGKNVLINLTILPPELVYNVKFIETGIPSGQFFSVNVNGIINDTAVSPASNYVEFTLPDGCYLYTFGAINGLSAIPFSGTVNVDSGPVTIPVSFNPAYYLNFTLPSIPSNAPNSGFSWTVKLVNDVNGGTITQSSHTNKISFSSIQNGAYSYSAYSYGIFSLSKPSGSVNVNGSDVNVNINITTQKMYPVIFSEKGLISGTLWGVVIDSGLIYPSSDVIPPQYFTSVKSPLAYTFTLTNGTYSMQGFVEGVGNVIKFTAPISITVNGKTINDTIAFTNSTTPSSSSSGYFIESAIGVAGGFLVGAGVVATYSRFRKKQATTPQKTK
ncbi:MAG: collagen binding domain-containing protein [Thermoplasmataceae archaeon]